MGIRSQVGIALKASIAEKVLKEHPWLLTDSDEQHKSEEGQLIIFHDVKWYASVDPQIILLYASLENLQVDDYLIVEACSECPDVDGGEGNWIDNPWNMRYATNVFVSYCEAVK